MRHRLHGCAHRRLRMLAQAHAVGLGAGFPNSAGHRIACGLFERLGSLLRLPDDDAGGRLGRCLGDLKPAGEQAIGCHDCQPKEFTLRLAVLLAEVPQQRNQFVIELDRKPGDTDRLLLGTMPG